MRLRTSARLLWVLAVALVTGLLFVTAAAAAPVSLAESEVWVQFWPEGEAGTNVVIVGVQLPIGTALPATVQLPVPEGATVYWAGEVMGSDPNGDIQRDFTMVDTANGKAAEFTVETTRSVQIDATYGSIVIDGNDLKSSLEWTQSVATSSTAFAVLMPSGTGEVTIRPEPAADPAENDIGEHLYTLPTALLQPGEAYEVSVVYRREGVEDLNRDSGTVVLWALGGLLAVAVAALIFVLQRQRRTA